MLDFHAYNNGWMPGCGVLIIIINIIKFKNVYAYASACGAYNDAYDDGHDNGSAYDDGPTIKHFMNCFIQFGERGRLRLKMF